MTDTRDSDRLRGITFAKQFPNPAEPIRGTFVAEQVRATRAYVDWRVIAPVPWATRWLAELLHKPYVAGDGDLEGIPVYRTRYPVLPRRGLHTWAAPAMAAASSGVFRRLMVEHRPQFVHAHDLYPSGTAAARLVAGTGVPLVVTVHGSDLYTNLVRPAWRSELRRTVASAAAVVCVGESLARDVVAEAGADPSSTFVIPDAYDDSMFHHVARPPRDGRRTLLAIGRLVEVKGIDVLITALATLVAGGEDLDAVIVGTGPREGALREQAVALRVADRVRFAGRLSQEELASAMSDADLFVCSSRSEGFGVALVEAMATGLPVVATRSGGPEDIVREGQGVLVAPNDAEALADGIAAALREPPAQGTEAISGDVRERYGREGVGRRLADLYRTVVSC